MNHEVTELDAPIIDRVEPEAVGLCSRRLERVRDWMARQVESRRLVGLLTLVARRDRVAFLDLCGDRDREAGKPLTVDTVFRIYSMTKPITSVAALMLYEEGRFQLDDPLSRYLPEFRNLQVFADGDAGHYRAVPAEREITVRDLMTHTAGLTYGFIQAHPVDALYRERGIDFQLADRPLAELVGELTDLPLLCQPGTAWNYSVATDVLGYLVEVLSGSRFDRFLQERILGPLQMIDTGFHVPPHKLDRFAACYGPGDNGVPRLLDPPGESRFARPAITYSGGGGLVSTAADYLRFARMLARGGELDGVRLLGRKSIELMTANHLPGDMAAMGQPRFSESTYEGIGFGLGLSVLLDPARAQILGSAGEFAWGGAASTAFWVDPVEELVVVLLTQLLPSSTYPLRRELRVLTYQAIMD